MHGEPMDAEPPAGTGRYVYGLVPAEHPARLGDLTGVGGRPGELDQLRVGPIAAVVGPAPPGLRARRRELAAHRDVVAALHAAGPVLPMRFGVVVEDERSLRDELARDASRHLATLDELRDRVEMNVKLVPDEDAMVRMVADRDPAVVAERRVRDGAGYQDQVRLGELVADAIRRHAEADGRQVLDALAPLARHVVLGPPVAGCALNASFLVDTDRVDQFAGLAAELADERTHRAEVRCTGPLPPYSFTGTSEAPP